MNGDRQKKPPTRRQLAVALTKVVPVLNGQSQNQDILKAQIDKLEAEWREFQQMTRWERLKWTFCTRPDGEAS